MHKLDINNIQTILGDRVLVKIIKPAAFNDLLIIPESNKEKPTFGVIVMVGDGKVNEKTFTIDAKIGDHIMFQKWTNAQEINEEHLLIKFSDIVAIIKK